MVTRLKLFVVGHLTIDNRLSWYTHVVSLANHRLLLAKWFVSPTNVQQRENKVKRVRELEDLVIRELLTKVGALRIFGGKQIMWNPFFVRATPYSDF